MTRAHVYLELSLIKPPSRNQIPRILSCNIWSRRRCFGTSTTLCASLGVCVTSRSIYTRAHLGVSPELCPKEDSFSIPWVAQVQRVDNPWLSMAVKMLSGCQQAVKRKIFVAQTHFLESTNQNTNVNTHTTKNKNRREFSSGCQETVRRLSGKNHQNFEAKIKFERWFRLHRRAYPSPSVLAPAKSDLHFRLSRGCSPSVS